MLVSPKVSTGSQWHQALSYSEIKTLTSLGGCPPLEILTNKNDHIQKTRGIHVSLAVLTANFSKLLTFTMMWKGFENHYSEELFRRSWVGASVSRLPLPESGRERINISKEIDTFHLNFHVPPTSMYARHTHTHRLHLSQGCFVPQSLWLSDLMLHHKLFYKSSSALSIPTKENIISFFSAKMAFGVLKGDCG